MLGFFVALALIVLLMLGYLGLVQLVVDPTSVLWRARRRHQEAVQARRASADLDREYASLVDEHRRTP